jgi:hypothetical protein
MTPETQARLERIADLLVRRLGVTASKLTVLDELEGAYLLGYEQGKDDARVQLAQLQGQLKAARRATISTPSLEVTIPGETGAI